MALTPAEEAGIRQLLGQSPQLLSLAGNEPAIIQELGAQDVTIQDLQLASSLLPTDKIIGRFGGEDKAALLSALSAFLKTPQGLSLGSAAYKDVGSGSGQIPDVSAFSSLLNSGAGWKKIPDASSPTGFFILQWGKFSGNGTIRVNGNFPIAFPNTVLISFGFMSDSAQFGVPSETRIVNLEATSQSTWGMSASGETKLFRFGFITLGF